MKVKKIHIENYRMLKRIDIDLGENLSLIIGKNNCGKTSFLSILNKFIGSQSSTNNFTYNDFNSDFQDSLFYAINLISIIMEVEIYLEDFLKKSNETEKPADINLLFIEEPEAHTHPQLQYVFIKNIKSLLIDSISDEQGNRLINLQTIITSHSSHIVSECDFDDIKYFKRSSNTEVVSQNLKELETRYKAEKDPERNHFKFLKQYLTLNLL